MDAVRIAVRNRENLLAEAPTGSGKTAAALHPALAEGLATGRQVVFLTSKTLQQKMAVSALIGMNERAFHTLQVRAKDRMCANDRILCHEEFCRFAKGYPEKMERSDLSGSSATGTPTSIPTSSSRKPAARRSARSRSSSSSRNGPTQSWPTTTTSSSPRRPCGT